MSTKNSAFWKVLEDVLSYRDVGQQHKLFDHAVGIKHRFGNDVNRIAGLAAYFKADLWTS